MIAVLTPTWLHAALTAEQFDDLTDWMVDHLGYLETEIGEIRCVDEGVVEFDHLSGDPYSYRTGPDGELLWETSTVTDAPAPPHLSEWEMRQ